MTAAAASRRGFVAALSMASVLVLAACSGGDSRGDGPWESGASATPVVDVPGDGEPPAGGSQGAGLVLSEVGFTPAEGEPAFVEVLNVGRDPVSTEGLTLDLAGDEVTIETSRATLAPGEALMTELDLDPVSGSLALHNAASELLDAVAWGEGEAVAVSMAVGDFVGDEIAPGAVIGRPPGSAQPEDPTGWVPYPPDAATPGTPNSLPGVDVLLPISGAILTGSDETLDWYPVTGAASYRVEVATDADFTDTALEGIVEEPQFVLGDLGAGSYVWRVTAVGPGGEESVPSESSTFEISTEELAGGPRAAPSNQLNVPWLVQHKDTNMLLLEEPHENAPMAWDRPHNPPSRHDPADAKNCALAMVAMVNAFYGGDLSQDRIGYQIFKDWVVGPERDLMYGYGLSIPQVNTAFAFALGAPVQFIPEQSSFTAAWARITASIDAGRPVPGAGGHHGYVITGYRTARNGHRIIQVNDPARGRVDVDLDTPGADPTNLSLWILPEQVDARAQEIGITRDRDGDGVVDFDEVERFKTDPKDADSDDDKLRDKQDIVTGVFDEKKGYARHRYLNARDWDGDLLATELDPDSDDGGCLDGQEDTSGEGHRTGSETWNFDRADDTCYALKGTITFTRKGSYDTGPGAVRSSGDEDAKFTVAVELQVDPNDPTSLVDAGESRFTVDRKTTTQKVVEGEGDCPVRRETTKSQGSYRFADPPVPSPGHTREEIGDGKSFIGAIVDPENGQLILQIVPYYPAKSEGTCGTGDVFGLPIVVDSLACGDYFGMSGLGVIAKIEDEPSGPDTVDATCTFEGPAFGYDTQKITTSGTLKLVSQK